MYVMADFICMWLLNLWGAQTENHKMKKFLLTVRFERGTFHLRSEVAKRYAIRWDIYWVLLSVLFKFNCST